MNNYIKEQESYQKSLKLYNKSLEKLSFYTEVVITVGFVGLFTLLNLAQDSIDKTNGSTIAFYVLVSLGLFVIWETIKMLLLSLGQVKAHCDIYNKEKNFDNCSKIIMDVVWIIFFILIIIPLGKAATIIFPVLFQYLVK